MNGQPNGGDLNGWGPYGDTVVEIACGRERLSLDVGRPVERHALGLLTRAIGATFAIVTAFNPDMLARGAADPNENLRAHAALAAELAARGLRHLEADGRSRSDPNHVEQGFAIDCDLATARALATAFGQDAFFWFDGTGFWIEPASGQSRAAARLY